MMRIFESKEYMTTEEAEERFYPYSVVMIQCEVDRFLPLAGYVVAAEETEDDYDALKDYQIRLSADESNGYVHFLRTSSPMEEEWIYVGDIHEEEWYKPTEVSLYWECITWQYVIVMLLTEQSSLM